MVTWLLLGTALYLLTVYSEALFVFAGLGVKGYLGSRDAEPTPSPLHGRAQRASRNYKENYPVFMALGILALVVPEADMGLAVMGAMTFVLARLIYLPLYLAAIPALRSTAFTVGWLGMIAMGWALVSG